MPELTSKHIVEEFDRNLAERIENLDTQPRLAILSDNIEHAPSMMYVGLKQKVARKLGIVATATFTNGPDELIRNIENFDADPEYHGIIVQLPLANRGYTDKAVGSIRPEKDVDGLNSDVIFAPATPLGILELIEGYGIDYKDSPVAIVGKGRLVGTPLFDLFKHRGASDVRAFDIHSTEEEKREGLNRARIIISATGQPALLKPDMFDKLDGDKVFFDAGTAESKGVVVGDISEELREWALESGCLITPKKGGVGPLTVRALLSNVVTAAENRSN
jgi:methylenetetrahydrofolate dehydrogenase (NADP+)/methenyltetrahydrofolate cyclohydrolase